MLNGRWPHGLSTWNWDADEKVGWHRFLKLPVPYDSCAGVPLSCLLTVGSTPVQHSVLNVKALVGAFNQGKALVGAFSVIVQLHRLIDLQHYYRLISPDCAAIAGMARPWLALFSSWSVLLYILCYLNPTVPLQDKKTAVNCCRLILQIKVWL